MAVFDAVAMSHMGKIYKLFALAVETEVPKGELIGTTVMPPAPVWTPTVPPDCRLEVEKQMIVSSILKKLLLAEDTETAGERVPMSVSLAAELLLEP